MCVYMCVCKGLYLSKRFLTFTSAAFQSCLWCPTLKCYEGPPLLPVLFWERPLPLLCTLELTNRSEACPFLRFWSLCIPRLSPISRSLTSHIRRPPFEEQAQPLVYPYLYLSFTDLATNKPSHTSSTMLTRMELKLTCSIWARSQ